MKLRRICGLWLALLLLLGCTACGLVTLPVDTGAAPQQSGELVLLEDDPAETPAPADKQETPEEELPESGTAETDPAIPEEPDGESEPPEPGGEENGENVLTVTEDGVYDSRDEVALYIHLFGHLPSNFITKSQAQDLGWTGGSLEPYAPGKCIGGGRFGNYEGLLPKKQGRTYTECDIDTMGARERGPKRIVYSNDGLIYYTDDHYESFTLLYGEVEP